MATKKKEEAERTETTFTKAQIVNAKRYRHDIDIVNALLDDTRAYTLSEVDTIIAQFKERKDK